MTIVVPSSIRVLMPNGRVTEMKLETYLAGAVVAEMGANAPLEALKAQAVASRTYAAAAHRHAEVGADVCTTAHCQKWKRVDPIVAPEVFRAVSETWGTVAAFDGKLIDAFFFDHCDGHTRSASDVHMSPAPYLQSVVCNCGFVALNGHGVGLCQRGAIVMARRGASFEEILQHYYCYVAIVHTRRERGDGKSVSASHGGPPLAHPSQTPAHKRAKASPSSAHKGKIAHKPIPPRRPAHPKVEKPGEEPTPVKRKAPPPLPPLPPFLMKKAEAEKKAVPKPVPPTPPRPPKETKAAQASPAETEPAPPKAEPPQTPPIPPPSIEALSPSELLPTLSLEPTAVEAPRAESSPPVAPAPTEPSEPVFAARAEPASPVAAISEPVETAPALETAAPGDVVAQVSSEPAEKALGLEEGAEAQRQTEIKIEHEAEPSVEAPTDLEVPAYVAGLNDPSLLIEMPAQAPAVEPPAEPGSVGMSAAAELPAEPLQEAPAPTELSEPCEPDSLPELTLPRLKMGKPARVHIDHLPGERMIAGCLSVPGIMITVLDQRGNETLVMSGSAPHYGEGGFETVVEEDGCYVVWIDGEAIKLEVHCDTAFIHVI